jgi:hypothetical protein
MDRKDEQELLWELIRQSGNNKTRAAKKLGMSRQLFNYYVNQTPQLPNEFIRKVSILLGKEASLYSCFLQKALHEIQAHPVLQQAEKQTKLSIIGIVADILRNTFNESIRNE